MGDEVEGAGGKTDSLTDGLSGVNSILGAVGLTISAGAFLDLAAQLDVAGAKANRITDSFNTFTGGQADEYATRIQTAVNGLIDDEDALLVSQTLINNGMARTSEEAAELVRQATILGAAFGQVGAKQAAEDFALLLNNLSPRQMKEFGLGIDEVRAKTQELMAANSDLTEREATRAAVLELAAQKAAVFNGVLDDQVAHLDALEVAWADVGESVGKAIAEMSDPAIVEATKLLNVMMDEGNQIATQGMSAWEQRVFWAKQMEAAAQAERVALIDNLEAMRQNRDAGLELAASQEQLAAATQVNAEAQQAQDAIYLNTLMNIDALTASNQGLAGTYDAGIQLLGQLNLTTSQQLDLYSQLGLATGEVTVKQLEQTQAMAGLTELYANGKIGVEAYVQAIRDIQSGADAAKVAQTTMWDEAIAASTNAEGHFNRGAFKHHLEGMKDATGDLTGTLDTAMQKAGDVSVAVNKINTTPVVPKTDTSEIEKLTEKVNVAIGQLAILGEGVVVPVTYVVSGDVPAGTAAAGGGGP